MNPLRADTKPHSIVLQLSVVKVLCRYHLAQRNCGFTFFPCQPNAHEDAPALSPKDIPICHRAIIPACRSGSAYAFRGGNKMRLMTASGVGSNYSSFPRIGQQGNLSANGVLLVTSASESRKSCFPSICLLKDLGGSLDVICEDRAPVVCSYTVPGARLPPHYSIHIKAIEALGLYCACLHIDKSPPATTLISHRVQF